MWECGQGRGAGWRDSEVVMALVLLNLAGGESVGDVEVLEKDEGFCRILRQAEGYGKGRGEGRRWRRGRRRGVPSASAVFRYLEGFHEAGGGGAAGSAPGVHTGGQRSIEGAVEGERGNGGIRAAA